MSKPVITAVVLLMAFAPACAQAQGIGGLVGDVVGGPRRGDDRHRYHHRCIHMHGHRYCR